MLLSIKDFAEQTGVNAVTLRAWERRYGLIQPQRTDKGHRLYSNENLQEISQILTWLNRGIPISQVKDLLIDNDVALVKPSERWETVSNQLLSTILDQRSSEATNRITQLIDEYSFAELIEGLLFPLLTRLNADFKNENRFAIQDFFQQMSAQLLIRLTKLQASQSTSATDKPKNIVLLVALGGQVDSVPTLILGNLLFEKGYSIQVSTMGIESLNFATLFNQIDPSLCYMIGTHRHSIEALENLKEEEVNYLNEHQDRFELLGAAGRIKQTQSIKLTKSWGDTDLFHFFESAVLKKTNTGNSYASLSSSQDSLGTVN